MYDINYEQLRVEHADAINRASRWSFWVYSKIYKRTQNAKLAADTASKVYKKILQQEGVPWRKNQ